MKPRFNQSGQATTEYLLLVILAVAIMIALGNQFYTPMKKWTDVSLGTYVTCLLDYGVLPSSSQANASECQQIASSAGSAFAGANGNANSMNNSSSNNPNADTADNAKKAAANAEAQRSAAASRRRNAAASASSNRSVADQNGRRVGFANFDKGTSEASNSTVVSVSSPGGEIGVRGRGGARRAGAIDKRVRSRGVARVSEDQIEKIANSGEVKISRVEGELPSRGDKKFAFKPPPTKKTAGEEVDAYKLGMGNIFRYAVMALIIGSIIYVVSTQLNAVSKSMD